ncbi:MAG: hypothetical protein WDM81_20555 [Rhizomicrobium sp.]
MSSATIGWLSKASSCVTPQQGMTEPDRPSAPNLHAIRARMPHGVNLAFDIGRAQGSTIEPQDPRQCAQEVLAMELVVNACSSAVWILNFVLVFDANSLSSDDARRFPASTHRSERNLRRDGDGFCLHRDS